MTINQNTTKINTIKNITLPELLQKINSLPDAGAGGGSAVETVTVTITGNLTPVSQIFYYTENNGNIEVVDIVYDDRTTISVVKNTVMMISLTSARYNLNFQPSSNNRELLIVAPPLYATIVDGDLTCTVS